MNIVYIAWYTLLRNIRDVKSMINMVLFPIILILILGNALGSAFDIGSMGKTKTAYLDRDDGRISDEFESFLNMDEIRDVLEITPVETYEEGIRLISEGKVSALISMEEEFTEGILSGNKSVIKIFKDRNNEFRSSIVHSIVEGFTDGANTRLAISSIGGTMDNPLKKQFVERVPLSAKGRIPDAMDYYSVTMVVLFAMYGSMYSLHGFCEDYLEGMRNRLFVTPARVSSHFAGKMAGTVVTVYLQTLVIILFTKAVYGVNWGGSTGQILLIAFTLSLFSVFLGLMAAMLSRKRMIGLVILQTVIPVMAFISGGYMRILSDSGPFAAIQSVMPNHLGHTAFFNTIYGGQAASSLAILWVMIFVMGAVSVLVGRRRLN